MRHDDPDLRDRLAAEYVLGTLQGRARERFRSLLRYDPGLRRLVADWEARLAPLAESIPAREPPAGTWAGIAARLGHEASPMPPSAPASAADSGTGRSGWWRSLAIAASLSTLALAALLAGTGLRPEAGTGPAVVAAPPQTASATVPDVMMAVLSDAEARPSMLVSWPMQAGSDGMVELRVRIIMDHPTMDPGTAWELWLLPRGADRAPRSVGLVGIDAEQRLRVDASMLKALLEASGLALSNEPAGGSPTGTPTGPVIFRGPCIRT